MVWDDEAEDGRGGTDTDTVFADRTDAGRRLARRLRHLRSPDVVVVGLPRGGVPVALEVSRELGAPLDVIVVRKLGVPFQPELAMGAIGEGDVRVINQEVVREIGISAGQIAAVEARERQELLRRVERFRAGRERVSLRGRVVVVVDDGVATGSTARAACQVVRAQGAARVVLAVPVAPVGWRRRFAGVADELVCVATPLAFFGISGSYRDFSQVPDDDVLACLARAGSLPETMSSDPDVDGDPDPPAATDEDLLLPVGAVELAGHLTVPPQCRGLVIFAHGSGSGRLSPRNQMVARALNGSGLATLLFDLLTAAEAVDRANVFDIDLLAGRLAGATDWIRERPGLAGLPVGWFGASTGAAAALWAAAEPGADVAAIVSRGGRPDLGGCRLALVRAPTLLIVGGADTTVLELNKQALNRLECEARLLIVQGATHLFEEPGALQAVAESAGQWFLTHLGQAPTAAAG